MQNEANHLSNLPDELKLILFSYINTFDLLQISELLPEYERFIYDKRLMRYSCFVYVLYYFYKY